MPPSNDDDHFIKVPEIARCRPHTAQIPIDRGTKLDNPVPRLFIGNIKSLLRDSIAQSELGIEPNGMANDIRCKSMASKGNVTHTDRLSQVPMPALPVAVAIPAMRSRHVAHGGILLGPLKA